MLDHVIRDEDYEAFLYQILKYDARSVYSWFHDGCLAQAYIQMETPHFGATYTIGTIDNLYLATKDNSKKIGCYTNSFLSLCIEALNMSERTTTFLKTVHLR